MATFSSTREQHPFFFTFPSREASSSSPSSASPAFSCPPGTSANACLLHKQRQMRLLVAERSRLPLPELLFASFVPYDQSMQILQQGTTVRPDSIAEIGFKALFSQTPEDGTHAVTEQDAEAKNKSKKKHLKQGGRVRAARALRFRVGNASAKRLLSGALAGAVSRTAVAPLETIRTHLMVGSNGHTVQDVFHHIMHNEGWQGLFRGNGVNVIRVAPSKAIELFAYDTIKKVLDKTSFVPSHIPVPTSSIAGAAAGVCSTICTYPLELLKTRLTIQRGVYKNLMDAFVKICQEEGPKELYRGLTPSLIGVVPYAATNYFAYDFLRKLYKKMSKCEQIGNLPTLFIGSAAGAFASASTFPLEVARKHMQVGAVSGRPVYDSLLHALSSILQQQGPAGLYRGLGASCIKLIPAAGISFMCYEACKRILIEDET